MENQHRKIKGYRELTKEEIGMMNLVKEHAAEVGDLIGKLSTLDGIEQRWVDIARDDLQKGFMSLTRAIAKPDFF